MEGGCGASRCGFESHTLRVTISEERWKQIRYSTAKLTSDDDLYNEWLDELDAEYGIVTPRRPRKKVAPAERRRRPAA